MFIGEYHHVVDEKGRLAIPVAFRTMLTKGAVVTRGLDFCLSVYSAGEWKKMAAKITSLPITQANNRAFSRFMLAGAMEIALDKQGRLVLPPYLRQYAKVGKEVVVAGVYDRFEIWDKDAWGKYRQATEEGANDIAEKLGQMV